MQFINHQIQIKHEYKFKILFKKMCWFLIYIAIEQRKVPTWLAAPSGILVLVLPPLEDLKRKKKKKRRQLPVIMSVWTWTRWLLMNWWTLQNNTNPYGQPSVLTIKQWVFPDRQKNIYIHYNKENELIFFFNPHTPHKTHILDLHSIRNNNVTAKQKPFA